jgi:hypothetical protein
MTRIDVDASRCDMPIKADLIGGPGGLKQLLSAGEPLNPQVVEQVETAWGLTIPGGVWTDRAAAADREGAGHARQARLTAAPQSGPGS